MSNIIRRLHAAYGAARDAGIEMREWRLSTKAHLELIASREAQSLWGFKRDMSRAGATQRTLMGQPVVIEHPGITTDEAMALPLEDDGLRAIPAHPVTICMSGIGKLGRWEYFDA